MEDIYRRIAKAGEEMVFAIVVESYDKIGRKALIGPSGPVAGGIGGALQDFAETYTRKIIHNKASCLVETIENSLPVKLYMMYIAPSNRSIKSIAARVLLYKKKDVDSWLVIDITDPINWKTNIYWEGSRLTEGLGPESIEKLTKPHAVMENIGGKILYCEPIGKKYKP